MWWWSVDLQTDNEQLDKARRAVVEAVADFMHDMDRNDLTASRVRDMTGRVFIATKDLFALEDTMLATRGAAGQDHANRHASLLAAFISLCKKTVPTIRTPAQANQTCIEIYQLLTTSLAEHLKSEVREYRRNPKRAA